MHYRLEQPADVAGIHRVVATAFERQDEANLVDQLRANRRAVMSAVAVAASDDAASGDEVVGHILFSPLTIVGHPTVSAALALAPLAVSPTRQNTGVGTALTRFALEACRQAGHQAVFVLGHPNYYPRFGFRCDLAAGFDCPYAGDHFMGLELYPGALAVQCGRIVYPPEFG